MENADPVAALRLILRQATELRDKLRDDLRKGAFEADDIEMGTYNDLVSAAASLVPSDPVLSKAILMPDASLRGDALLLPVMGLPPSRKVTKRLEGRLTKLINRLDLLVGDTPQDIGPARPAWQVLREERSGEAKTILDTLERLRFKPGPVSADQRDFNFVSDSGLRDVLKQDFVEAQLSFAADAFKATALLAGATIEGMLLDVLQSPDTKAHPKYVEAVREFPKSAGQINWDRVSLTQLIHAGLKLSLLTETEERFVQGARDYRDTVHPNAEVRQRTRAKKEEAEVLLALVKLIYRNLDSEEGGHA